MVVQDVEPADALPQARCGRFQTGVLGEDLVVVGSGDPGVRVAGDAVDPDALAGLFLRAVRLERGDDVHLHAQARQSGRQCAGVGAQPADDVRWVLPTHHQNAHRSPPCDRLPAGA